MLIVQSKLVDFKTNELVGVICINGETSVALSLDKAKDLNIEDIDIIQYLGVDEIQVAIRPNNTGSYARLSSSIGEMPDFEDVPYERVGSIIQPLDCKEVIWGIMFNFASFVELDNEIAIKRALIDAEKIIKGE